MKFSHIKQEQWSELQPYLDTCLLPLTGLTGSEAPWEVTQALERLRDVMDIIEQPFNGRVVTYPAIQYKQDDEQLTSSVNALCQSIKLAGFRYVILITADRELEKLDFAGADLFVTANDVNSEDKQIATLVENMWRLEV